MREQRRKLDGHLYYNNLMKFYSNLSLIAANKLIKIV